MILSKEQDFNNIIHTYKRNRKKIKIGALFILVLFSTFFLIKIFTEGELRLEMKITEYINREMDRILQYKTREKQNEEFKKLKPKYPLVPVRMTPTTAVFKYTSGSQNIILKRVIHNPTNNLNEDYMSMSLVSPYVCKAYKSFRTKRTIADGTTQVLLWICLEYLDVKISQDSVGGDEKKIRQIVTDALKGLQYLHSRKIAHLDIKIGNIMGHYTSKGLSYKLIDFGYSQVMPEAGFMRILNKTYGTYPYKPPEIVFSNIHGFKSDIWSLGAVCWFLSLQYTPFYFDNVQKDLQRYRKFLREKTGNPEDKDNHRFHFSRFSTPSLRDFVKTCMQVDPEKRPTVEELLEHPFITGKKTAFPVDPDDIEEISSYDDLSTTTDSTAVVV